MAILCAACDSGWISPNTASNDVELDVPTDTVSDVSSSTCDDGMQNGQETDVDCGGPDCAPCEPQTSCTGVECDGGETCYRGTCYPSCDGDAGCDDAERCYDEQHCAPLDCSGVTCRSGESCYRGVCYPSCQADTDCADAQSCVQSSCVDPCEELDCAAGETCYRGVCYDTCNANADCDDVERCHSGGCVPVDCGGVDCRSDETCYFGACLDSCTTSTDCSTSGAVCDDDACVVPTCTDGVKNGKETDVDCGGADCAPCSTGQACATNSDCTSNACEQGTCAEGCDPTSCASSDSWIDTGAAYDCCDGGQSCTCQDQEYRSYACDGNDCTYSVTDTQTVTSGCASCVDNDACTVDSCSGGSCQNVASCAGTATSCGCDSCTDCTTQDGWYDTSSSYGCCDDSDQECMCQDQEYRTYTCNGTSCVYDVTDTRTVTSGCISCDGGDSCTAYSCSAGTCHFQAYCAGTDSSCGCTSCTDCTAKNDWYPVGNPYACCDSDQECMCQDQEYRVYTCDGTSCTYSSTNTRTVTSGCSSCDDASACTANSCSQGTCHFQSFCSGTDTSCGCTSCANCDAKDGWYASGSSDACCDGASACICQPEEYRDYSCDGTSCTYTVTNMRTTKSNCSNCQANCQTCSNGACTGGCTYPDFCCPYDGCYQYSCP